MFWSKIWYFLFAVAAAIAVVIALVMPAPAERMTRNYESARLKRACDVANILLKDNARVRTSGAAIIAAPDTGIPQALSLVTGEAVSDADHTHLKTLLLKLNFNSGKAPDFIIALDRAGRVVARTGENGNSYGESMRGYFLVDDALDGYVRDDLWLTRGQLFAVSAVPVVTPATPFDWAGVIVTGRMISNDFTKELKQQLDPETEVSFYSEEENIASSTSEQIHSDIIKQMTGGKKPAAAQCGAIFNIDVGNKDYEVIASGLPGEAGELGAYFTVSMPRNASAGFAGTLRAVTKNDLNFGMFPWIPVATLFLFVLLAGIGLMWWETDKPLRRLAADAVGLAKGEGERLNETLHRGKVGSIARSINVAIDKLLRETKSAKSDLDQLLGPLPGQNRKASKTVPPTMAMPVGLGIAAPAPSEFRFSDSKQMPVPNRRKATSAPVADAALAETGYGELDLELPPPPPNVVAAAAQPRSPRAMPATNQQVVPQLVAMHEPLDGPDPEIPALTNTGFSDRPQRRSKNPQAIDDDILGDEQQGSFMRDSESTMVSSEPARIAGQDADSNYFREVFEDFVALKRKCGEKTDSLTFEKFSVKLRNNRDALQAKHGCKSVKFQVYVKDGRAALKASPVR